MKRGNQGRTQGEVGGWLGFSPFSLTFYKNLIACAKKINCFRILFACYFVDLLQIPRNEFACKFQGTL